MQGRLRHTCPAKVNKILTCTEVVGLNQFPDLPPPLDFLSSHTVRFYLKVLQGEVFFVLLKVLHFLVNEYEGWQDEAGIKTPDPKVSGVTERGV